MEVDPVIRLENSPAAVQLRAVVVARPGKDFAVLELAGSVDFLTFCAVTVARAVR